MITLAADCLLFRLASGESVPFSAEMLSFEVTPGAARSFDEEVVKQAAKAVFHYFRHELGRDSVTVGEFAGALEKVLKGFKEQAGCRSERPHVIGSGSDLRELAGESGAGCELLFFPMLRADLRRQLQGNTRLVRFRRLRDCVKHLAGTARWSSRCRHLEEQILEFLRECLSAEAGLGSAMVVE